jgi:hypothetical protein
MGSYPKHKSRKKCKMDQEADKSKSGSNISSISQLALYNDYRFIFLRIEKLPKVGDIWVLHYAKSFDHFTYFFIPSIKVLFQAKDKILKVESFR